MTKTKLLLAAAVAAGFWLAAPAAAQCTFKCGCNLDGCGCQSTGGNGSGCDASGNGCFVLRCSTSGLLDFGPDGSVITEEEIARPGGVRLAFTGPKVEPRWEKSAPGVLVARNCRGLVVARRYTAAAAAGERKRSTRVVI